MQLRQKIWKFYRGFLFSRIRTNTIIIQIKVLTCVLTSNARKTKQFRIRSKLIRFRVAVVSQCRPYLWPFVISRGCDVMSHLNRGDVTIKMAPKSTCPVLTFANRLRFRNYRRNIANPSTDRIAQTDPVSRFLRDLYYRPKCQLCAYLKMKTFASHAFIWITFWYSFGKNAPLKVIQILAPRTVSMTPR